MGRSRLCTHAGAWVQEINHVFFLVYKPLRVDGRNGEGLIFLVHTLLRVDVGLQDGEMLNHPFPYTGMSAALPTPARRCLRQAA
ncbi:MAG: hypothetical protein N2D54_12460, partial [Chloroflexota bacterium]